MASDIEIPHPSRLSIVAAFATVYVVWGSTYLAIRFAIETLPPFIMAGTRFLVAGALLYVWARFRSGERPSPGHWRSAFIIGGLMLLGGNGGVVWAEQFVASGLAALIVATVPLWMVLFEWLGPDGTRPTRLTLLGLITGFVGVAVLVGGGDGLDAARVPWIPGAVLLFASASWAAGSLYSRRALLPCSPLVATAMEMLGGGTLLLLAGALTAEGGSVALEQVSTRSALSLAYLILFGSILAFTAYIWLLRVTTPARVSTYAYVNPVVAVALGWLLASEPFTPRIGLAAALIVAAVFAVIVARDRPPAGLDQEEETG
jgi:drug/metabolite transporter (DMT)-like permease